MKRISKWLRKYFIPNEGNDYKPHSLAHDSVLAVLLFVIIIQVAFLVQTFVIFNKTNFLASVLPSVLTDITNEQRAENSAAPLVENDLLQTAAQEKADDMATKGYFAHTSPEGKLPWYWFNKVGYKYTYAGENLAVNFFDSKDVADAWMLSPAHRANIIKKEFTQIGIGVAEGSYESRDTVFVVQFFGTPAGTSSPEQLKVITTENTKKIAVDVPATTTLPKGATPIPSETKVLGTETASSVSSVVQSAPKQGMAVSFIEKVLTSPRQSSAFVYEIIALVFFVALLLAVFIKFEIQHPIILARGIILIAVILFLSYIDIRLAREGVKVDPTDSLASVVQSLR